MNRRSFLAGLGLAPVGVAVAAVRGNQPEVFIARYQKPLTATNLRILDGTPLYDPRASLNGTLKQFTADVARAQREMKLRGLA